LATIHRIVHQTDAGTTVLSVPRDLVALSGRTGERLALTWLDGAEATVDALCGLGIPPTTWSPSTWPASPPWSTPPAAWTSTSRHPSGTSRPASC
jgi:hypothetical protein